MTYYYIEVDLGILKPKHRIDYCFRCRLEELYQVIPPKFQSLIQTHDKLFRAYLARDSKVSESEIRDILRNAGIDFKLRTPTYLAHKYNSETVARDMINGFSTGRYDNESRFYVISIDEHVYDYSAFGSHIIDEIEIFCPVSMPSMVSSLIYGNKINLKKYGKDLMDCALSYTSWSIGANLKLILLDRGIKYPFNSICRLAATNSKLLINAFKVRPFITYRDAWKRNTEIAQTCTHIHPDHKRVGLNILDILVFQNPEHDINDISFISLLFAEDQDKAFLVKSLRYWLENVRNEAEFDLIYDRILVLENAGFEIDLIG